MIEDPVVTVVQQTIIIHPRLRLFSPPVQVQRIKALVSVSCFEKPKMDTCVS
jgi:hypothetical protein